MCLKRQNQSHVIIQRECECQTTINVCVNTTDRIRITKANWPHERSLDHNFLVQLFWLPLHKFGSVKKLYSKIVLKSVSILCSLLVWCSHPHRYVTVSLAQLMPFVIFHSEWIEKGIAAVVLLFFFYWNLMIIKLPVGNSISHRGHRGKRGREISNLLKARRNLEREIFKFWNVNFGRWSVVLIGSQTDIRACRLGT